MTKNRSIFARIFKRNTRADDESITIKHKVLDIDVEHTDFDIDKTEITQGAQWVQRCVTDLRQKFPDSKPSEIQSKADQILVKKMANISSSASTAWFEKTVKPNTEILQTDELAVYNKLPNMTPVDKDESETHKIWKITGISDWRNLTEIQLNPPFLANQSALIPYITKWYHENESQSMEVLLFHLGVSYIQFTVIQQAIINLLRPESAVRNHQWTFEHFMQSGKHCMFCIFFSIWISHSPNRL